MKKLLIPSVVAACLAGFMVTAFGQNTAGGAKKAAAPAATTPEAPHKIGLIDMGRVFKEYEKFNALREDWKGELTDNEGKAKAIAAQVQKTTEDMKQWKSGSAEFIALEKKQTQQAAEFESFRKNSQRDLMRKEADIYKTIYLESMDVVKKFADHYGYTLVMRFNSEGIEGEDLQKLQVGLNRVIVYHRSEDDLTDGVIKYLNTQYKKTLAAPARPAGAGAPKVANKRDDSGN